MIDSESREPVAMRTLPSFFRLAARGERPEPDIADASFTGWLRRKRPVTIAAGLAGLSISSLVSALTLVGKFWPDARWTSWISLPNSLRQGMLLLLQAAVIFAMLWFIPRIRQPVRSDAIRRFLAFRGPVPPGDAKVVSTRLLRAERLSSRFVLLWELVWGSYVVLYVCYGTVLLLNHQTMDGSLLVPVAEVRNWEPALNFLNNLTTVFLIMCYRELSEPTREDLRSIGAPIVFLTMMFVFSGCIELLALNSDEGSPLAGLGIALATGGGLAQGVALALVVGRLDSKLLQPPLSVIALLYLYAAIQGPFSILARDEQMRVVLTSLAFALKIVLFSLIAWLLQTGLLAFYLAEVRSIHDGAPERRRAFVQAMNQTRTGTG